MDDRDERAALQDRYFTDNVCFGCGQHHQDGLRIRSFEDGGGLTARWVPDERFQGPPGVVNGGVMAIPMDCHGTWTAMWAFTRVRGEPVSTVTAGYCVRLTAPTPVGATVVLRSRVDEVDGRKAKVQVTATVDGDEVASLEGTFVALEGAYDQSG